MSVTLDCTCAPFVREEKVEFSSDCGDSGRKKCKRGCGGAYGGVWRSLAESAFGGGLESRVRRSVLWRCVWKEFSFNRREDVFTYNLIQKKFYKFCTFHAVFRDNPAVNWNCSTHKRFIPVNFDGSYCASYFILIYHRPTMWAIAVTKQHIFMPLVQSCGFHLWSGMWLVLGQR
jgi:hypothetical protein